MRHPDAAGRHFRKSAPINQTASGTGAVAIAMVKIVKSGVNKRLIPAIIKIPPPPPSATFPGILRSAATMP